MPLSEPQIAQELAWGGASTSAETVGQLTAWGMDTAFIEMHVRIISQWIIRFPGGNEENNVKPPSRVLMSRYGE